MEINEYIEQYKNKGGYIQALREHIGHAPIITIGVGVIIENVDGEILLQRRRDNVYRNLNSQTERRHKFAI